MGTVKQVKKKVKKGKDKGKTVTKEVRAESFFHFFNPPALPDDPEAEIDEEVQMLLQQDFQIGHYLRERIVPRAVLFFTGEEQGTMRKSQTTKTMRTVRMTTMKATR